MLMRFTFYPSTCSSLATVGKIMSLCIFQSLCRNCSNENSIESHAFDWRGCALKNDLSTLVMHNAIEMNSSSFHFDGHFWCMTFVSKVFARQQSISDTARTDVCITRPTKMSKMKNDCHYIFSAIKNLMNRSEACTIIKKHLYVLSLFVQTTKSALTRLTF